MQPFSYLVAVSIEHDQAVDIVRDCVRSVKLDHLVDEFPKVLFHSKW